MNTKTLITLAIALLGAASAFAGQAPAQTHGDREVQIVDYASPSTLTRAQVLAETTEALRLHVVSRSETNTFPTDAQLHSVRVAGLRALPMDAAAQALRDDMAQFALQMEAPKTRAQVAAELAEAQRLGVVSHSESNTFPTPAQSELVRQAGLKALPMTVAAR
ncbi:hypothetical protein BH11PSE10_BH11PSE10_14100 [soil metagenome]